MGSDKPSSGSGSGKGSGLYVDVENLRSDGQRLINMLIDNWPSVAPTPARLCLYVRADLVELWRLWATSHFQGIAVDVKGIQHFSTYSSKNSADIAIATSAMADFLLGRIGHVVVLSDDSDFISLYAAIRDELIQTHPEATEVPFLWVVTDRGDSLSSTVKQYFPPEKLHVVTSESPGSRVQEDAGPNQLDAAQGWSAHNDHIWEEIAQAIIEQIPVGKFKSTDCQGIIKKYWPRHSLSMAAGPAFGIEFQKNIWPILQQRGVTIANPGRKPIRYEMTPRAKHVQP